MGTHPGGLPGTLEPPCLGLSQTLHKENSPILLCVVGGTLIIPFRTLFGGFRQHSETSGTLLRATDAEAGKARRKEPQSLNQAWNLGLKDSNTHRGHKGRLVQW